MSQTKDCDSTLFELCINKDGRMLVKCSKCGTVYNSINDLLDEKIISESRMDDIINQIL